LSDSKIAGRIPSPATSRISTNPPPVFPIAKSIRRSCIPCPKIVFRLPFDLPEKLFGYTLRAEIFLKFHSHKV